MDTFIYKGVSWRISYIVPTSLYLMSSWDYLHIRDIYSGFRIIKSL